MQRRNEAKYLYQPLRAKITVKSQVQVLAVQHQLSVSLDIQGNTYPKQGLPEHVVDEARREVREQSALMRLVLQNGELLVGAGAELLPNRRVPVVHFV